ncbi:serine-rich adhesin for platelets [Parasteatoda tepidariorum]|uniref:serine-rich adhesin for platelets n=1 Tax=Parasteatoda tepidariorum TaxID=114398 RepID=UPI0039BC44C0
MPNNRNRSSRTRSDRKRLAANISNKGIVQENKFSQDRQETEETCPKSDSNPDGTSKAGRNIPGGNSVDKFCDSFRVDSGKTNNVITQRDQNNDSVDRYENPPGKTSPTTKKKGKKTRWILLDTYESLFCNSENSQQNLNRNLERNNKDNNLCTLSETITSAVEQEDEFQIRSENVTCFTSQEEASKSDAQFYPKHEIEGERKHSDEPEGDIVTVLHFKTRNIPTGRNHFFPDAHEIQLEERHTQSPNETMHLQNNFDPVSMCEVDGQMTNDNKSESTSETKGIVDETDELSSNCDEITSADSVNNHFVIPANENMNLQGNFEPNHVCMSNGKELTQNTAAKKDEFLTNGQKVSDILNESVDVSTSDSKHSNDNFDLNSVSLSGADGNETKTYKWDTFFKTQDKEEISNEIPSNANEIQSDVNHIENGPANVLPCKYMHFTDNFGQNSGALSGVDKKKTETDKCDLSLQRQGIVVEANEHSSNVKEILSAANDMENETVNVFPSGSILSNDNTDRNTGAFPEVGRDETKTDKCDSSLLSQGMDTEANEFSSNVNEIQSEVKDIISETVTVLASDSLHSNHNLDQNVGTVSEGGRGETKTGDKCDSSLQTLDMVAETNELSSNVNEKQSEVKETVSVLGSDSLHSNDNLDQNVGTVYEGGRGKTKTGDKYDSSLQTLDMIEEANELSSNVNEIQSEVKDVVKETVRVLASDSLHSNHNLDQYVGTVSEGGRGETKTGNKCDSSLQTLDMVAETNELSSNVNEKQSEVEETISVLGSDSLHSNDNLDQNVGTVFEGGRGKTKTGNKYDSSLQTIDMIEEANELSSNVNEIQSEANDIEKELVNVLPSGPILSNDNIDQNSGAFSEEGRDETKTDKCDSSLKTQDMVVDANELTSNVNEMQSEIKDMENIYSHNFVSTAGAHGEKTENDKLEVQGVKVPENGNSSCGVNGKENTAKSGLILENVSSNSYETHLESNRTMYSEDDIYDKGKLLSFKRDENSSPIGKSTQAISYPSTSQLKRQDSFSSEKIICEPSQMFPHLLLSTFQNIFEEYFSQNCRIFQEQLLRSTHLERESNDISSKSEQNIVSHPESDVGTSNLPAINLKDGSQPSSSELHDNTMSSGTTYSKTEFPNGDPRNDQEVKSKDLSVEKQITPSNNQLNLGPNIESGHASPSSSHAVRFSDKYCMKLPECPEPFSNFLLCPCCIEQYENLRKNQNVVHLFDGSKFICDSFSNTTSKTSISNEPGTDVTENIFGAINVEIAPYSDKQESVESSGAFSSDVKLTNPKSDSVNGIIYMEPLILTERSKPKKLEMDSVEKFNQDSMLNEKVISRHRVCNDMSLNLDSSALLKKGGSENSISLNKVSSDTLPLILTERSKSSEFGMNSLESINLNSMNNERVICQHDGNNDSSFNSDSALPTNIVFENLDLSLNNEGSENSCVTSLNNAIFDALQLPLPLKERSKSSEFGKDSVESINLNSISNEGVISQHDGNNESSFNSGSALPTNAVPENAGSDLFETFGHALFNKTASKNDIVMHKNAPLTDNLVTKKENAGRTSHVRCRSKFRKSVAKRPSKCISRKYLSANLEEVSNISEKNESLLEERDTAANEPSFSLSSTMKSLIRNEVEVSEIVAEDKACSKNEIVDAMDKKEMLDSHGTTEMKFSSVLTNQIVSKKRSSLEANSLSTRSFTSLNWRPMKNISSSETDSEDSCSDIEPATVAKCTIDSVKFRNQFHYSKSQQQKTTQEWLNDTNGKCIPSDIKQRHGQDNKCVEFVGNSCEFRLAGKSSLCLSSDNLKLEIFNNPSFVNLELIGGKMENNLEDTNVESEGGNCNLELSASANVSNKNNNQEATESTALKKVETNLHNSPCTVKRKVVKKGKPSKMQNKPETKVEVGEMQNSVMRQAKPKQRRKRSTPKKGITQKGIETHAEHQSGNEEICSNNQSSTSFQNNKTHYAPSTLMRANLPDYSDLTGIAKPNTVYEGENHQLDAIESDSFAITGEPIVLDEENRDLAAARDISNSMESLVDSLCNFHFSDSREIVAINENDEFSFQSKNLKMTFQPNSDMDNFKFCYERSFSKSELEFEVNEKKLFLEIGHN